MRGTPEGRYFAGMSVVYYIGRERENALRKARHQKGLAATEMWFKGFVYDKIAKQISNLGSVLEEEVPPIDWYIRGSEGAGVENLSSAISTLTVRVNLDANQRF